MGKGITKSELGITLGKLQKYLLDNMAVLHGAENTQTRSIYDKCSIELGLVNDILLALQGDKVNLNIRHWTPR